VTDTGPGLKLAVGRSIAEKDQRSEKRRNNRRLRSAVDPGGLLKTDAGRAAWNLGVVGCAGDNDDDRQCGTVCLNDQPNACGRHAR
jgi:hypothetical protein